MQVVLENINREPEIPESAEPEAVEVVEAPPEPQEPAIAEEFVPAREPTPPAAPAPKKVVGHPRQGPKLHRQLPR